MDYLSLFDLQQKIKDSLISSFPLPVWVVAEIGEIKVNYSGHCYLELVEKDRTDNLKIRAKVSANIWAGKFRLLKTFFESTTRVSLEQGLKVLVRVDVRYHEIYGLSLNVVDIDPSFTVGEMKLQRNLIIQKLMNEGIVDLNKELTLPIVPQRIAVVSSATAAGYQDFVNHISANQFGYNFEIELFASIMQGNEAESSIVAALERIFIRLTEFDVVVIIRGGGSQIDLACFDSYVVSANVAQFPLPVLSGIGHDKDESVVDVVAYQSFKTPTAVASFLVDVLVEFEEELVSCARKIGQRAQRCISEQKLLTIDVEYGLLERIRFLLKMYNSSIAEIVYAISKLTSVHLNGQKRFVDGIVNRIERTSLFDFRYRADILQKVQRELSFHVKSNLTTLKHNFENIEVRVGASSPHEIMKKGYSLTFYQGQVVRQLEGLEGEVVETFLQEGRLISKVVEVNSVTEKVWQKKS